MTEQINNLATALNIIIAAGADPWSDLQALVAADAQIDGKSKVAIASILANRYPLPSRPQDVAETVQRMITEIAAGTWEDFGFDSAALELPTLNSLKPHIVGAFVAYVMNKCGAVMTAFGALLSDPVNFTPTPEEEEPNSDPE